MILKRLAALAALLAALAAATPLSAAPAGTKSSGKAGNDKEAIDLLRQIEAKHGAVRSVSGKFHQVSADPDQQVGGTIESDADFYLLKPGKFRAEYQAPYQATELITEKTYFKYTPSLGQVLVLKFTDEANVRDLNYVLLGFGAKVEDVLKVYSVKWLTSGVEKGYYGIQLVPIDKQNATFNYITMLITADANLFPAQFSMEQQSKLRLTVNMNLKSLKIDSRISESKFVDDFPKSAKRVDNQ